MWWGWAVGLDEGGIQGDCHPGLDGGMEMLVPDSGAAVQGAWWTSEGARSMLTTRCLVRNGGGGRGAEVRGCAMEGGHAPAPTLQTLMVGVISRGWSWGRRNRGCGRGGDSRRNPRFRAPCCLRVQSSKPPTRYTALALNLGHWRRGTWGGEVAMAFHDPRDILGTLFMCLPGSRPPDHPLEERSRAGRGPPVAAHPRLQLTSLRTCLHMGIIILLSKNFPKEK